MFVSICDVVNKHYLSENIKKVCWTYPDKGTTSLAEIYEESLSMSVFFREGNIVKGDCVAIIMDNSLDYASVLLALWHIGAIAVPIKHQDSQHGSLEEFLNSCDDNCEFKALITEEGNPLNLCLKKDNSVRERSIYTIEDLLSFGFCHQHNPCETIIREVEGSDIAILQYSSGSTGSPKGIIVTHFMMMNQLGNLSKNSNRFMDEISVMASWLPFHHDMGLFIGVLLPLYLGCENIICSPRYYMRNPLRWFNILSKYRVNGTFTTNSALGGCLELLDKHFLKRNTIESSGNDQDMSNNIDLSHLHIILGAEKVSSIVVKKAIRVMSHYGLQENQIHTGYGMAETTLGVTCSIDIRLYGHYFRFLEESSLMTASGENACDLEFVPLGEVYENHKLTIHNDAGEMLGDLLVGEIHVEGPGVSPGYYKNPTEEINCSSKVRHKTGDLGFTSNGEIFFVSRKDDMVVIGGRNIIADDIEEEIETLGVCRRSDSCFFQFENESGLSEPVALIGIHVRTPKDDIENIRSQVIRHIYKTHGFALSRVVCCKRNEIEKTSSGKKRRKVIKQRYSTNKIENLQQLA